MSGGILPHGCDVMVEAGPRPGQEVARWCPSDVNEPHVVDPAASPPTEPAPPDPGTPPSPDGGSTRACPSVTPPAAARPRRRWPWAVAVVVLLTATGAMAGIAWQQREVAATWRQRALGLEVQRDEARDQGAEQRRVLEEQLAVFADAVARSEADVADLEERLRALADEKAQAEDAVVTGEVEREALREVSARVGGAVEALDTCVTQLFDLQAVSVAAFNRAAAGETVDVEPLNVQASRTTDFCNEARAAAATAGAAADQLLGP